MLEISSPMDEEKEGFYKQKEICHESPIAQQHIERSLSSFDSPLCNRAFILVEALRRLVQESLI